jgi:hypothetical protein
LTYPEEPVLKVELEDKIKGTRKDHFELEQQARVPDSIKCLSNVKKDTLEHNTVLAQGWRKWYP